MALQIEAWLAKNYADIKAETGRTWEELAQGVEHVDEFLARWFREQPEDGVLATTATVVTAPVPVDNTANAATSTPFRTA